MNTNLMKNIRMKMAVSDEYRNDMIAMLYTPHGSKYDTKFLVDRSIDFEVLDQYIYELKDSDDDSQLVCTVPGGIYTDEEIKQLLSLVDTNS